MLLTLLVFLRASAALPASAATKFWDGNGTTAGAGTTPNGTWDTTTSLWTTNSSGTSATTTWTSGDAAIFSAGTDATGAFTVTVNGTQTASAVTVQEGTITQNGGIVDIGGGTFTINTGALWSISHPGLFNAAGTVVLNGGTLKQTEVNGNGGNFIPPTKGLEINGTGIVNYTNSGTGSPRVSIYHGTITGTGGTTSNGGAGTLIKMGPDEFRYAGPGVPNTTFAKLVVNEGLFQQGSISGVSDERAFGAVPLTVLTDAITLNGGAIGSSVSAAGSTLHPNRGVTIGPNGGTFNGRGDGVINVQGPLSGSGTITVTNSNGTNTGGLTLSNSGNVNTFTGAVVVDQATLTLNESLKATNFSGSGGTVSIASGRTFTVGSGNADTTYAGSITGAGAITKIGTGALTLTGDNSYAGGTTISAGKISGSTLTNSGVNSSFGQGNFSISNGSILEFSGGTATTNRSLAIGAGGGQVSVSSASGWLTLTGLVSGSSGLTKSGPGMLSVADGQTYSGLNTISGGTMSGAALRDVGLSSSFGTGNFAISGGATLQYTGAPTSTNRTISLGSGGGATNIANSLTLSGIISGSGGLTHSGGTLVLSAANTYNGGTTINGGRLVVNGSISGPVTVNSGGTLGGNGNINGAVTGGGRVAPGNSPDILHINGDYTQSSSGTLEIEFGGLTAGPNGHDKLIVSGNANLDGRLEVPIINTPANPSFVPQIDDTITFLTASQVNGVFQPIAPNLTAFNAAHANDPGFVPRSFVLEYYPTEIKLRVVPRSGDNDFVSIVQTANWSDTTNTWSAHTLPTGLNAVEIQNLYSAPNQAQFVNMDVANAVVDDLIVKDLTDSITVTVKSGKNLTATTDVVIDSHGTIKLESSSTLNGANVSLQGGGQLSGDGKVGANLMVTSGTLSPGLSVGHLDVQGNYQQGAGGTLSVQIQGAAQFDTVAITGSATLAGKLLIDASGSATITPGTLFPIMTATSITGTFSSVETTGNNNVYFVETTIGAVAYAESMSRGDMNGDGIIDNQDFDLFAFGLMNRSTSKYFAKCNCQIFPQQGGDFSGNGRLDFDDIAGFQIQVGGMGLSYDGLVAAIDRYSNPVPEPASDLLMLFGIACFAGVRLRK